LEHSDWHRVLFPLSVIDLPIVILEASRRCLETGFWEVSWGERSIIRNTLWGEGGMAGQTTRALKRC